MKMLPGRMAAKASAFMIPKVLASRGQCNDTMSAERSNWLNETGSASLTHLRTIEKGVESNHAHAKSTTKCCRAASRMANAYQTQRPPTEFVAHQVFAAACAMRFHVPVGFRNASHHRQHQSHCHLGDRIGVSAGLVHDDNARCCAGIDINRVAAGPAR